MDDDFDDALLWDGGGEWCVHNSRSVTSVFGAGLPRGGADLGSAAGSTWASVDTTLSVDEGGGLEDDGYADVQMPVGHVVVQHAGALLAADRAPEQAGGVNAHAEDQRWRDEAWSRRRVWTDSGLSWVHVIMMELTESGLPSTLTGLVQPAKQAER
ncbi:hypothetical protein FQN60_011282 [Etheostoma spectabile]|uniref:Uncharacterized protein n=1 Tax=Etheostoma spectabile TaxID=54343 RepID=A0A5J5DRS5_9PERO|nr:hypothetical protein FQN60_011282 [Etheostoma spectabile]